MSDPVRGADGLTRCPWGDSSALSRAYHDTEWGREVRGEQPLYERISLEAFQSGLSWITILRKRPAFREAFAGFDVDTVADFDDADVTRLLGDVGIVRNRAKIEATIGNARVVRTLGGGLSDMLWSFAPAKATSAPVTVEDVPAVTAESRAMARELKGHGFRFVGPTTAYALMQATGMVNDHLADCHARQH